MNVKSLTLNSQQIAKLKQETAHLRQGKAPAYANYQVKDDGITITVYDSGKVVFQGEEGLAIAQQFEVTEQIILPQAGSDETGTGSYFGPICVCACYIDQDIYQQIKHFNLADSKQISDDFILKHGDEIRKIVPHSLLVLDNQRYNKVQGLNNQNQMKAKMHNQAFIHLQEKIKQLPELTVIDQFTPKASYYKYLSNETNVIKTLTFETKAENKYIAVATASIIARYAFIDALRQLTNHYQFNIPSGAGSDVDIAAQRFVDKFGFDELVNVAKIHFKNTLKIKR